MRVSKFIKKSAHCLKSLLHICSLLVLFFLVVHSIELVEFLKTWGLLSNKQCLENIAQVVKHTNFHLYRICPARVIWKKPTIEDNYINKQVQLLYIKRRVSLKIRVTKKKNYFNNLLLIIIFN